MDDPGVLGYLAIAVATVAVTYGLVPVAMRAAVRWGILDRPGGYKQQVDAVPYLGGAVIALAVVGGVAVAGLVRPPSARAGELWVILGVAAAVALVGLYDDLRGMGPVGKLAAILAAALALWAGGIRVDVAGPDVLDLGITLLWIVGITNAMNLLDNMDGLSAGVAAIGATAFFGLAAVNGQYLVAALALAVAGAAVGFLPRNTHPARVYMGDAGSLFLGVMLAVVGIKLRFPNVPRSIAPLIPISVLSVPILDTTVVVISRIANHRPVWRGARDHLSHRLTAIGLAVPVAVGLIWGGVAASAWLAVIISRLRDPTTAWALAGLSATLAVLVGLLLGHVPVHGQQRRHLRVTSDAGPPAGADPAPAQQQARQ